MMKKFMHLGFHLTLVLFLLGFANTLLAQNAAAQLQGLLGKLNAMQANFNQTIRDETDKVIQQSDGDMSLSRPGRFRWETKQPLAQLIIANDKELLIYDPDLEQLQVRSLVGQLGRTPALLLTSDEKTVINDYQIKLKHVNDQDTYTLTPNYEDADFEHLELTFQGLQLTRMQLWDKLGQKTQIEFSQIKTNQPVSPSLFRFRPPAGVDIIR